MPPDPDGAWPHIAVRDLIEELRSEQLEGGLKIGVYNSRGVFMKSPTAGGEQERQIAERYQGYANQVSDRWPRTAAMLRRIARSYISDARREDINAELTEDLWR
jgi:alpha-L-fucosidase